jgi:hypothetical protein
MAQDDRSYKSRTTFVRAIILCNVSFIENVFWKTATTAQGWLFDDAATTDMIILHNYPSIHHSNSSSIRNETCHKMVPCHGFFSMVPSGLRNLKQEIALT